MICSCGLEAVRVLSTRTRSDGVVLRRRQCPDGHRWTSYEMHEAVVNGIGAGKIATAAAAHANGIRRRQQAQSKRELVAHYPHMGASELAALIGCTEARVRQLRAEAIGASNG